MTAFGQSFDRCPKAWLRDDAGPEVMDAIEDWERFERKGVLPLAGGFIEQPARFVEAHRVIQAEVDTCKRIVERLKAQAPPRDGGDR